MFDNTFEHRRFDKGGFRGPRGPQFGPGGPGFGPGGPFGRGRGFGPGGPRARKGDIRAAILSLLAEGPNSGYGLLKAIGEKTGGAWTPSPGSVYPTLAQLVDEELIAGEPAVAGRSEYHLTDAGRAYIEANAQTLDTAWANASAGPGGPHGELFSSARKLLGAMRQFAGQANDTQVREMTGKLDELRREIYRTLGE